jgi:hypothetical protein
MGCKRGQELPAGRIACQQEDLPAKRYSGGIRTIL